MNKLPFSPLSPSAMAKLTALFMPLGGKLAQRRKSLQDDLDQAQIDIHPRVFCASALAIAFFYAVFTFIAFLFINVLFRFQLAFFLLIFPPLVFVFMLFSIQTYPRIIARRRMRKLEANLIPALRHLLVEIRAGVPLFAAMRGVSTNYAEVSEEFAHIVKDVSTGMKEGEALSEAARRSPSFQFRRSIWQITNALRSGSDIGGALSAIIDDLFLEQITAIRRYGQELNPWTMIYMVGAVIIPSLGLTFLTIISTFAGATFPKIIFPLMIFALVVFQLFFMNFVKSRRPAV